jgi:hypothetical protein
MKSWCLAVFLLFCSQSAQAVPWLDDSYEIFLTKNVRRAATSYRDFPVFWWDFFIFEKGSSPEATKAAAEKLCDELGRMEVKGIKKLPCHFSASDMHDFAESWLADAPLRRDFPGTKEFRALYQETLGKAALPLPRDLLEWLRLDPLDELTHLKTVLQGRSIGTLKPDGPYLVEPESGHLLLPIQFDFPPTDARQTSRINAIVQKLCKAEPGCPGVTLFGPHAGSMENEFQIREDINSVSIVGTLSLLGLILFILWSRRYPLLYLLPIMGVTIALSAGITVAVFGSIHAISLSFGPGLVGLAMDYGIHAAFLDPRSRHTWRSNFMALITSLVIMILLGFSSIPLLQQMMFFGSVGLTLTYIAFYFAMTRFPEHFTVKPFDISPKPWRLMEVVSLICLLGAALIFFHPLRLDLKNLSFETPKTAELGQWFFTKSGDGAPYTVPEEPGLREWALLNHVRYEGVSVFLPPLEEQQRHADTWRTPCAQGLFKDDAQAEKFFAPFTKAACSNLNPLGLTVPGPAYLSDFNNGRDWTAILFPGNDEQAAKIRERFPQANSPREIIATFPKTFTDELSWMLPIAIFGALSFLIYHYRSAGVFGSAGLATLACLPFLTGVGAFSIMAIPLELPITFVSLAGLLMVFGFSLDYGIFAVDYMINPTRERRGVWSALVICAVSTNAGFTPMAMGQHPVLHNLGNALLWGSVGTFIGTFWAVPAGYRWLFKRDKVTA